MTTAVASPQTTMSSHSRVTFGRLVRAEWITLTSLRGSIASLIIGFVVVIAPAMLMALMYGLDADGMTGAERTEMLAWLPSVGAISSSGVMFSLVVATIVATSIYAKEHTTGSLRTQLAASPRRVPMFTAKAVVVAISTFTASLIAFALAFAGVAAMYSLFSLPVTFGNVALDAILPIVGSAAFTAFVALFALGIAGLYRSETWTITSVLAFLFVLPTLLMTLPWDWAPQVADVLLSSTGRTLTVPQAELGGDFFLDLALTIGWSAVAFFGGAAVMNRRDA